MAETLRVQHVGASVPYYLVLYGLGGTGKSQLALDYIDRHLDLYDLILWIDARDKEAVQASFERCVVDLGLQRPLTLSQEVSLHNSVTSRTVLNWIENQNAQHRWLVVFDNADDMTWGLKGIMPKGSNGSILITSRDEYSVELIEGEHAKLHVEVMQKSEARALLLQHLHLRFNSTFRAIENHCDIIAEELGFLPLAIDLAGLYINHAPDSEEALRHYTQNLKKHKHQLLRNDEFIGLCASDKTVWTVWETTIIHIEALYKHTNLRPALLLTFLAHFHRDTVEEDLFRLAHDGIQSARYDTCSPTLELPDWLNQLIGEGEEWDKFYYQETLKPLLRYGLLHITRGPFPSLRLHGLVKWRARHYKLEKPWNSWRQMLLALAAHQILAQNNSQPMLRLTEFTEPPQDCSAQKDIAGRVWVQVPSDLVPPAPCCSVTTRTQSTVFHHISPLDWLDLDSIFMNDAVKIFIWKTIADSFIREIEDTKARRSGWDECRWMWNAGVNAGIPSRHPGICLNPMYHVKRFLSKAEEQSHWFAAPMNFTRSEKELYHPEKVQELYTRVIELSSEVQGSTSEEALTAMTTLASFYRGIKRTKESSKLSLQVLRINSNITGVDPPLVTAKLLNLAPMLLDRGYRKQAKQVYEQAIENFRLHDHRSTITRKSTDSLAALYLEDNQWTEAEILLEKALSIKEKVLGAQHSETIRTKICLARVYWFRNNEDAAVETIRTIVNMSSRSSNMKDPGNVAIHALQLPWSLFQDLDDDVPRTVRRQIFAHAMLWQEPFHSLISFF